MALEDLVASQPNTAVSPSADQETVMADNGDQASATPANADGNNNEHVETGEENESSRFQQRINELTRKAKEAEEKLLKETAAREAIERNLDHFSQRSEDRPLDDFSSSELKQIIAKAKEADEPNEEMIDQASQLYIEKLVEERTEARLGKENEKKSQEDGAKMTNLMIDNLTEGGLRDTSSQQFVEAEAYLNDLLSDDYKNINMAHLAAAALSQVNHLKRKLNGPSPQERVLTNRNNTLKANTRVASSGGYDDLQTFLNENERLGASPQGSDGTAKQAIKKLSVIRSFDNGG